ncbi:N-acetylmuramoyl-L-alanine amidase [bacterium]|nr:N-acetylmuramoyl-L-alanine amidase [bacterium]
MNETSLFNLAIYTTISVIMKKLILVLMFILFASMISPVYAAYNKPWPLPVPTVPNSVCIDPGHGDEDNIDGDNGTSYIDPATGEILYQEDDINLDVARILQTKLGKAGYSNVWLTRDDDYAMTNRERYEKCNGLGAAILVSIHHNGSSDPSVNYTLSLYKKDVDIPLARIVSEYVSTALGLHDEGISLFTSGVLLKSDMPATISEAFFLTNENVVSMIEVKDEFGENALDKEARGLLNAINNYFSTIQ